MITLAAAVADLAGDDQRLVVVLDGPLHLPQVRVGEPQIAQICPLAAAVADLATSLC